MHVLIHLGEDETEMERDREKQREQKRKRVRKVSEMEREQGIRGYDVMLRANSCMSWSWYHTLSGR